MIIMQTKVPYATFTVSSGNVYVADQYGLITNVVSSADQASLAAAGCATLTPNPTDLLGYRIQANFNSTADQIIANLNNALKFRIRRITVCNATVSLTTALGGLYTAAAKGGSAIVAAGQAFTALSAANIALDLTIALPNITLPAATPLYLSLSTPQGVAALADVYVYGDAIPVS